MDNQKIGSFELQNNGGFVVRMDAQFRTNGNNSFALIRLTDDFEVGQSRTADPGAHGVPDGADVRLVAHVSGGTDKTASQIFKYKQGNANVARYTISGTTLDATLSRDDS